MRAGETQSLYSERASYYERVFVGILGWGRELERFFRSAEVLRPGLRILDAGCGTGIITRTLHRLAKELGHAPITFHAFDLTPGMLDVFRQWAIEHDTPEIEIRQADVLEPGTLPSSWREYDLVISSTMLEYLPGDRVREALINLRSLMGAGGRLQLIVTRGSFLTRLLGGLWWHTNLFDERELRALLLEAGFRKTEHRSLSRAWSKFILVIDAEM
jgi:SAM-dependent methyltransferase